jgi:hypothetical protein
VAPVGLPGLAAFAAAIEGSVVLPGSPDYELLRKSAWAQYEDVRPKAVVLCSTPADVAETIAFARRVGAEAVARSGGHCFAGRSSTRGIGKAWGFVAFREAVQGYGLLPRRANNGVAYCFVAAELLVAVSLLAGFEVQLALLLAAILLAIFTAVTAVTLLQGKRIACGCLGAFGRLRLGWISLAGSLLLSLGAVVALSQPIVGAPLPLTAPRAGADELIVLWSLAVLMCATYWLAQYGESVVARVEEAIATRE